VSRYRLVYLGLGLAFVAVIAATWVLSVDGSRTALPAVVERISPAADATVLRQTSVVVDVVAGYSIELSIDGVRIPASELEESQAIGLFEWTPGPAKSFSEWTPGTHRIDLSWNTATGLPDIGTFSWVFYSQ